MLRKRIDEDKERSERKLTKSEFLTTYNKDLPKEFPRATHALLSAFRQSHPGVFHEDDVWTLDQHRKKLMDWLPQHLNDEPVA